jgi:hypothetical protein
VQKENPCVNNLSRQYTTLKAVNSQLSEKAIFPLERRGPSTVIAPAPTLCKKGKLSVNIIYKVFSPVCQENRGKVKVINALV